MNQNTDEMVDGDKGKFRDGNKEYVPRKKGVLVSCSYGTAIIVLCSSIAAQEFYSCCTLLIGDSSLHGTSPKISPLEIEPLGRLQNRLLRLSA